jgi:hypothetical protein
MRRLHRSDHSSNKYNEIPKVKKNYLIMKLTYEEIKEKIIAPLNALNVGVDEEKKIIRSLSKDFPWDQH